MEVPDKPLSQIERSAGSIRPAETGQLDIPLEERDTSVMFFRLSDGGFWPQQIDLI
ncbi:hypothetical protein O9929_06545 [Vibrio lentus]|nr:hypothetical protein [Vibrio lentus]